MSKSNSHLQRKTEIISTLSCGFVHTAMPIQDNKPVYKLEILLSVELDTSPVNPSEICKDVAKKTKTKE